MVDFKGLESKIESEREAEMIPLKEFLETLKSSLTEDFNPNIFDVANRTDPILEDESGLSDCICSKEMLRLHGCQCE